MPPNTDSTVTVVVIEKLSSLSRTNTKLTQMIRIIFDSSQHDPSLSHGRFWMWGWRMDTGHDDGRQQGIIRKNLCQALRYEGHQSLCMGVSYEIEREDHHWWSDDRIAISIKFGNISHAMTANKPATKCATRSGCLFGLFSRLCRCCSCAELASSVVNTTQNNYQYTFLMSLCHHSVLLRCYQFEMLYSLSRTPPLNPALLTLCHPHWLANVRISSQFSQK